MRLDLLRIPKLRKFEGARAVAIRLFNLNENPLEMFGVVIRVVQRHLDPQAFEFRLVYDRHGAIDPHGFVNAWDDKQQADAGIAVHIAIGLKEPVARYVGQQEMAIVEHAAFPPSARRRNAPDRRWWP